MTANYSALIAAGHARVADMTLAKATDLHRTPAWACACIGPPYCCLFAYDQARALHRAAHIAARQMADLLARG